MVALPNSHFVLIELKVVSAGLKINLSPHQYAFHIKHAALGCPTFVVVEVNTKVRAPELLLFSGAQVADVAKRGILADCVARWPLAAIDWTEFHQKVLQMPERVL
jgi:hypothetical protein